MSSPARDHGPVQRPWARGDGPISRWVGAVDCRAVVAAYGVTLDHTGVGRCPWPEHHAHGDRDRSFQVGRNNRWWCHTLGEGGSALDFVMRMEHITDPKEALRVAQERWPVPGLERPRRCWSRTIHAGEHRMAWSQQRARTGTREG